MFLSATPGRLFRRTLDSHHSKSNSRYHSRIQNPDQIIWSFQNPLSIQNFPLPWLLCNRITASLTTVSQFFLYHFPSTSSLTVTFSPLPHISLQTFSKVQYIFSSLSNFEKHFLETWSALAFAEYQLDYEINQSQHHWHRKHLIHIHNNFLRVFNLNLSTSAEITFYVIPFPAYSRPIAY